MVRAIIPLRREAADQTRPSRCGTAPVSHPARRFANGEQTATAKVAHPLNAGAGRSRNLFSWQTPPLVKTNRETDLDRRSPFFVSFAGPPHDSKQSGYIWISKWPMDQWLRGFIHCCYTILNYTTLYRVLSYTECKLFFIREFGGTKFVPILYFTSNNILYMYML